MTAPRRRGDGFNTGLSANSTSRDINNFVNREHRRGSSIGNGTRAEIRSFARNAVARLSAGRSGGRSSGT